MRNSCFQVLSMATVRTPLERSHLHSSCRSSVNALNSRMCPSPSPMQAQWLRLPTSMPQAWGWAREKVTTGYFCFFMAIALSGW